MKKIIGLRPKCYAYLQDDGKINKRAKWVSQRSQKDQERSQRKILDSITIKILWWTI